MAPIPSVNLCETSEALCETYPIRKIDIFAPRGDMPPKHKHTKYHKRQIIK
jgi:hypothetical protein